MRLIQVPLIRTTHRPRRILDNDPRLLSEAMLYAQSVVSGDWLRPVGYYEKLRCKRFIEAYEKSKTNEDYPWAFSRKQANHACEFLEGLQHFRGTWAKKNFHMIAWQVLFIVEIYGWRNRKNLGLRRYNECYAEIARGNGKSFLAAAIGLYELVLAGGRAAEVVSAATTGPQAAIVMNAASSIVKTGSTQAMGYQVVPMTREIRFIPNDDPEIHKFYYVNANSKSLDGLAQCLAIVDELHAHKDRKLWDVLASGRGKVPNSWILSITTAGYDQNGLAYGMKETGQRILEGGVEGLYADRTYFMMHCLDKGDSVFDMKNVEKANPLFSFSPELREEVATEADGCNPDKGGSNPAKRAEYETKRCNIWRQGWANWLSKEEWGKCRVDTATDLWEYIPKRCRRIWIGVDMATNVDFASIAMVGVDPEIPDKMYLAIRNYLPEDVLQQRIADMDIYKVFSDKKEVHATPGDMIDQDSLLTEIEDVVKSGKVRRIWFDHFSTADRVAADVVKKHGKVMVATLKWSADNITPGAKEFEERVRNRRIVHEGRYIDEWMVTNAVAERRVNKSLLPKKPQTDSEKKIDAVHSSVLALSAWRDDPLGKLAPKKEGAEVILS